MISVSSLQTPVVSLRSLCGKKCSSAEVADLKVSNGCKSVAQTLQRLLHIFAFLDK